MLNNPFIVITGNIVKPELKYTASGQAYINFSIPVSERKKNEATGRWEDVEGATSWYRCVAFGQIAENISESCPQGTRITVQGRIKMSNWTTPEGVDRTSAEIVVDECSVDLRFATATVHKAERSDQSATAPAQQAAPQSAGTPFG